MKTILCNAFSLQMLNLDCENNVNVKPISQTETAVMLEKGFESAIGHESTADVLSNKLKFEVQTNRANIKLDGDTELIVAQFVGGRLPEGAKTLPDNMQIKFVLVSLG